MKNITRGSNIKTFEFEEEQVWLITDNNGKRKPVQNWTTEGDDTFVYFKMNASFFNSGQVLGRNVGHKENLEYIEGRPDQQSKPRYDVVIYDDKTYAYGQFMSWDYTDKNITCGYTVPLITVAEGQDVNYYSEYIGRNANTINCVNTYVGLIKVKNGPWVAFNSQKNSPKSLRTYFRTLYDVEFMCINDGGGSTQTMHYDGSKKVVTDYDGENRAVVNVIAGVIDKRGGTPVEPPKPVEPEKPTELIKTQFGMEYLNITQGRFEPNGISHKYLNAYDLAGKDSGIDPFYAQCNYKIAAVLPLSTTGFANTILYYDELNDVTLALTHMNTIDTSKYYVGKVFEKGEKLYEEGKAGNATGNHIHLEIGKGYQTKKVNKGTSAGGWQLNDLIDIEDYFYIDESFTTVINDRGYKFETSGEPTPVVPTKEITKLTCVKSVWKDGSGYTIRSIASPKGDLVGKIAVGATVGVADFVAGDDNWAWVKLTDGTFIQFDKDYLEFAAENVPNNEEELNKLKEDLAATKTEVETLEKESAEQKLVIAELNEDNKALMENVDKVTAENKALEIKYEESEKVALVLKDSLDRAEDTISDVEAILKNYKL